MKSIKPKLRRLVVLLAMLSCAMNSVAVSPHAATRPAQDDKTARQTRALLEACLKQGADLDYLTAKSATLEKLDQNNKDLISALESQVAAQQKTIEALKAANKASAGIEVIDSKELKSYQDSLKDAQAQLAKWKGRAAFWRRFATFGLPLVLVVGAAIGYSVK